ncbi:hypothetical protein [Streptomyces silvisoli]|uniref:DinB family protein n=1 Tax=Streptomyces silvisoli TaxID=3034235 RepID=A0ABT5ZRF7_9ACTN|nr:hypothetical protein [Streptomyces silvisoli]MDF3292397.1 hypothetical protein [Streptomyces silvisoli]
MTAPAPSPNELHQRRLQQLATYLRESELILANWDAYSDEHTDESGWPHDQEAYGLRAAVRDAETWTAFNRVRSCAKDLLATAEVQLQQLDATAIRPHWPGRLAALHHALDRLNALQHEWLETRATLPASAKPGTEAYDDVLDERNSEAWHYLGEWSAHGQALLDIHAAALKTPSRLPGTGAAPSRAPAPPAASATSSAARR